MSFASVRRFGWAGALLVVEITACSGSENTDTTNGANGGNGTNGPSTSTATVGTTGSTTTATSAGTVGGSSTASVTTSGATTTGTTNAASSTGATTATTTATSSDTSSASTTGAGGSSSTTGANTTDGTTSTTGGPSSAVVNDDFESVAVGSPPDPAVWQLRLPAGGSNSIEVTSEQAHSGSQSVKVMGSSGSTMFFTESVFPLPSGVVYFRVWMRFTDANWSNHNAFVASGPGEESQEVRFGGQNNAYHANLAADSDALSPDPYKSPACERCVAPVANEWKCLRGKLDFANNVAELYVGDELAVDSAADGWHNNASGTFPANPTQIGFGWALYGAMANTVYYDDLAIGYEPIACE